MHESQQPPAAPLPFDHVSPQPLAWRWLLLPALAQLALHLATNGNFGVFRDEYYYLACAARPDWGYVDQPALSIWILAAWKTLFGDSVYSIRLLPALCGPGLVLLTGAMAAEIGGRRWAQLLAGFAAAIGAAGLVICGFYSMNCFDLLFTAGAFFLLLRIARTGDARWWPWLGLVVGLGLLNKIGLLVFGMALVLSLLATPQRRFFADRRLYLTGLIAAAFMLPYVLWNATHGWATWEFVENARRYKIAPMAPLDFLVSNILMANPVTLPLWIGGLVWFFVSRRARNYRFLGIMFALTFVILVLEKGKPYYLLSTVSVLLAAGGVAWEGWTSGHRGRWLRWLMTWGLVLGGSILAPIAVPLLSPEATLAYSRRLHIAPKAEEVGHTSVLPQYFSDRLGWEKLARTVSQVYQELSGQEREHCAVLGRNYGHAGALEYWSKHYPLPRVYSTHNNYWFWGPPSPTDEVFLVTGGERSDLESIFESVVLAAESDTPYARESHITIWVCRGLRHPGRDLWQEHKNFI